MCSMKVVLPEPRKPVNITTFTLEMVCISEYCFFQKIISFGVAVVVVLGPTHRHFRERRETSNHRPTYSLTAHLPIQVAYLRCESV